jgi:hypothetical protein
VFEELGMMPELDRWVVRHVVQRLQRGSRSPAFSVNLSGQTLADRGFPAFVADERAQAGVAPQALLFELDDPDLAASLDAGMHVPDPGLRHDAAAIGVDAAGQDAEPLRDLLARAAFDHKLQDVDLARA